MKKSGKEGNSGIERDGVKLRGRLEDKYKCVA